MNTLPMRPTPGALRPMRRGELSQRKRRRRERAPSEPRDLHLWLPLTPLFVMLSPFALALLPILALILLPQGINPVAALGGVGEVLLSLGGTDVDIDGPRGQVRIRIF